MESSRALLFFDSVKMLYYQKKGLSMVLIPELTYTGNKKSCKISYALERIKNGIRMEY